MNQICPDDLIPDEVYDVLGASDSCVVLRGPSFSLGRLSIDHLSDILSCDRRCFYDPVVGTVVSVQLHGATLVIPQSVASWVWSDCLGSCNLTGS